MGNKLNQRFIFITIVSVLSLPVSAVNSATLTRDNGAPVGDNQNSQTAGPNGPVLLQDIHLIQKLQRFDRERIPERVVHARGAGAHGEFVSTADISDITKANVFKNGSKTPVFVRFSLVIHGNHSPETLRDPRGFAVKFYTAEGNWDLVGNNLPVFFIRDAMKFPDMVHAFKPAPDSNIQDPNRVFDFFSSIPESTHMLTRLYSDFGIPASYRNMQGNGVHAFKLVNQAGKFVYVKFNWKPHQKEINLTQAEANKIQSTDFNHASRDLQTAITNGDFPKWDLMIQVLKPEELAKLDFNPLDDTKIWPGIASKKIGTLTLNKNPENIFQETEQSAFAPSNMVPGIEPSEDRMLQGRLFSYADTQFHRVGVNVLQLPINQPKLQINTNNQDGELNAGNRKGNVNYEPSQMNPKPENASYKYSNLSLSGTTQQKNINETLNFRQAGEFYKSLSKTEQDNLISNLSTDLSAVKNEDTRNKMISYFYKADQGYGVALAKSLNVDSNKIKALADKLKE